jgi:hypothetical protein
MVAQTPDIGVRMSLKIHAMNRATRAKSPPRGFIAATHDKAATGATGLKFSK